MTDETPKKTAAPKTRTVYLVGSQRGGEHGEKRVLSADDAATLVENGHARYASGS